MPWFDSFLAPGTSFHPTSFRWDLGRGFEQPNQVVILALERLFFTSMCAFDRCRPRPTFTADFFRFSSKIISYCPFFIISSTRTRFLTSSSSAETPPKAKYYTSPIIFHCRHSVLWMIGLCLFLSLFLCKAQVNVFSETSNSDFARSLPNDFAVVLWF